MMERGVGGGGAAFGSVKCSSSVVSVRKHGKFSSVSLGRNPISFSAAWVCPFRDGGGGVS